MKRMFKSTISLLLIAAFLLTPLVGTTASAVVEDISESEITANDTATKAESTNSGYSYVNQEESSYLNLTSAPLSDGIYRFKSLDNQKYMNVYNYGVSAGTPIVQWDYSQYIAGSETINRAQVFKVTYLTTSGGEFLYSIRTMMNNAMVLGVDAESFSNTVCLKDISFTDSYNDLGEDSVWRVSTDGTYYTFKTNAFEDVEGFDYGEMFLLPGFYNSNGETITVDVVETENEYFAKWVLEPVGELNGVDIINYKDVFLPKSSDGKQTKYDFDAVMYSSLIGRNGPVTFSVTDIDGTPTDKAAINSSTGEMTVLDVGAVRIGATFAGAPQEYFWNIDIKPLENGTYMISNKKTSKYLQSDNSGTDDIKQYDFDRGTDQKWNLVYHSSPGYYLIKNRSNDMCLTAPSSTTSGGNIIEQAYSPNIETRQLWTFIKLDDGHYKIQSKSCAGTSLVMVSSGTDGVVQGAYTNDSDYKDEWKVILPISGSEIPYNPGIWNDNDEVLLGANCYSYALNTQVIPSTNDTYGIDPGIESGYFDSLLENGTYADMEESDYKQADVIEDCVYGDAEIWNFVFERIDKYTACPQGSYKVALVVDPGVDYHWYRQNPDGTWSHKPGETEVIDVDEANDVIYDPEYASRAYTDVDYDYDVDYSLFVGFFRITPLNNMYSPEARTASVANYVEFDSEKVDLPDYEETLSINVGMTYSQVTDSIGLPQCRVTFGSLVVKYEISNGKSMFIWYLHNSENEYIVMSKNYK